MEFERIIEGLKQLPEVSAICLGGSRASGLCDLKSDYDVYVYYKDRISLSKRREILSPNCTHTEIGVNYFEEEDDCILNNGVVIELIYRSLADFEKLVDDTLTSSNASLGYSTCFFDNILHAKPLYDREGAYRNMAEKLRVYPEELRQNIIKKNTEMLHGVIASYDAQILKAYGRGDKVSVNHRIAAYLASYFDVIFALNKIYHPGEKRLVETVKSKCAKVPADFEKNINALLGCENLEETLNSMYNNLKILL
ncbi:MAG: nucleotidyltransferase domain-containing protein [Candidatus Coproplasma sp.]